MTAHEHEAIVLAQTISKEEARKQNILIAEAIDYLDNELGADGWTWPETVINFIENRG